MPDKPLVGGTRWTQEGIDPAKAYWVEAEAYRVAIMERILRISDQALKTELLEILNRQGHSLNKLRDALHELEIIGLQAKKDRLNGETS